MPRPCTAEKQWRSNAQPRDTEVAEQTEEYEEYGASFQKHKNDAFSHTKHYRVIEQVNVKRSNNREAIHSQGAKQWQDTHTQMSQSTSPGTMEGLSRLESRKPPR